MILDGQHVDPNNSIQENDLIVVTANSACRRDGHRRAGSISAPSVRLSQWQTTRFMRKALLDIRERRVSAYPIGV
jgi:hypothetical protein